MCLSIRCLDFFELEFESLFVVVNKDDRFNFIYQNIKKWYEKIMCFFKKDKGLSA